MKKDKPKIVATIKGKDKRVKKLKEKYPNLIRVRYYKGIKNGRIDTWKTVELE